MSNKSKKAVEVFQEVLEQLLFKGEDLNHNYKDLGQMGEPLRKPGKHVAANCADTLAKLHSRTKFVEQKVRNFRMVSEQDAEFAVQSSG